VAGEDLYLLPPLSGFPGRLAPAVEAEVVEAFTALIRDGDVEAARATADRLLRQGAGAEPARVLQAQAEFAEGRLEEARELLLPVVERLPSYTAAQLLLARVAERLQDIPLAYEAYRKVAPALPAAAERADGLRPRALEILGNRVQDAIGSGRLDRGREWLGQMQEWDPEADATLEAARDLAEATGDEEGELDALRALVRRRPEALALARRQGELEVRVGDAGRGLQILQALVQEHPRDVELANLLAEAKFFWRVNLLPPEIQQIGRMPQLTRGDFAPLLFWIFPDIRYGRSSSPRIANDIFDSSYREEIVRVVNMGLMDVDPDLHRFYPERPITRAEALLALLRLMAERSGELACLGDMNRTRTPSRDGLCETAAGCGLLEAAGDCLPGAPISGPQALEMARRVQELLGSS
jgi:hypothetical protein